MMYNSIENPFSHLWTAEQVNNVSLFNMWHCCNTANGTFIECSVPDADVAKTYIEAKHISECYGGEMHYLLDRHYTLEEADEYCRKKMKFEEMHLDMRDRTFVGDNGKMGLRDVCGKVIVEPQFDDFPELYTCFERSHLIPVVNDDRYYLYNIKERKLLTKGYDRIFRYFGAWVDYFVAVENGKKGILDSNNGTEAVPVIMDEIYEVQDSGNAVPYEKDGKYGFLFGLTDTGPIFEHVIIRSEQYFRVLMDGKWGWIDYEGKFTTDESKACFGNWYNASK